MKSLRLAVLVSGRGTNLQAILEAQDGGNLGATVEVVLSDKKEAHALDIARERGIPAYWINPREYEAKEQFEEALLAVISRYRADYILLAGFMRVLTKHFITRAKVPILNIHPALLPSFPGLDAQRQAVEYGVRYSGCTVHFVDEGVDSGPIILQAVVPVYTSDTEDTLARRILQEEHRLYPQAVRLLAQGRVACQGRKVIITGESDINE